MVIIRSVGKAEESKKNTTHTKGMMFIFNVSDIIAVVFFFFLLLLFGLMNGHSFGIGHVIDSSWTGFIASVSFEKDLCFFGGLNFE